MRTELPPANQKKFDDGMAAAPKTTKPKLLIIGHGRHGKDTVAELLAERHGYSFCSSSWFAAEKAIMPLMKGEYPTVAACYDDKDNHRDLWFHAIAAYNLRPGPSLAEQILQEHDIYVGMRSKQELIDSRHIFDLVIWVDASYRLPPEPSSSNELCAVDADYIVRNNLGKKELIKEVDRLAKFLGAEEVPT